MQIKRFDLVSCDIFIDQIRATSVGYLQLGTVTPEGIVLSGSLVFNNTKFKAFSEEEFAESTCILVPVTNTIRKMIDSKAENSSLREHLKIVKVYHSDGYSIVGIHDEDPLSTVVDLLEQ